ncbi:MULTISPECIES: hypothetical protein [Paraburkholderia]|uniref:hypothetical protein n=1 Tax=Paraburkholderia TaxID=1822464 RepID=UPI00035ED800|nr:MULTISPECIES: hypothetical protein [Paraburkholderia]MDH6153656.1 hypothetical protein [Paraburkholderia sp. WSM4179]
MRHFRFIALATIGMIFSHAVLAMNFGTFKKADKGEQERQALNATYSLGSRPGFSANRTSTCMSLLDKGAGSYARTIADRALAEAHADGEDVAPVLVATFTKVCKFLNVNVQETADDVAQAHRFDNLTFGQFRALSQNERYAAFVAANVSLLHNTKSFNENAYLSCQQAAGGGSKFADFVMRNIFGSSSDDSRFFDDFASQAINLCQQNGFRVVEF